MNFSKKALLGSLLALSTTSALAVDTADLRVIGTIAPTACIPNFTGGGTVDYGKIPTTSLNKNKVTVLAPKTISYTIVCDAPIAIAISWSDSRNGTAVGSGNVAGVVAFGLGTQGKANIGAYAIIVNSIAVTDGATADVIYRERGGAWGFKAERYYATHNYDRVHSYAPTGTLSPGAFTTYSSDLDIIAQIAPTSTLDLTNSITLDGLSTMTVRYL